MLAEKVGGAPEGEREPGHDEPEDELNDGFQSLRIMHRRIMSVLTKIRASEKKCGPDHPDGQSKRRAASRRTRRIA